MFLRLDKGSTKVSDIGQTNIASVGPYGLTPGKRFRSCRSLGADAGGTLDGASVPTDWHPLERVNKCTNEYCFINNKVQKGLYNFTRQSRVSPLCIWLRVWLFLETVNGTSMLMSVACTHFQKNNNNCHCVSRHKRMLLAISVEYSEWNVLETVIEIKHLLK